MLGLVEVFTPKFVKKYANVGEIITVAISQYIHDVKELRFPKDRHAYKMKEGEAEKLNDILKSLGSKYSKFAGV